MSGIKLPKDLDTVNGYAQVAYPTKTVTVSGTTTIIGNVFRVCNPTGTAIKMYIYAGTKDVADVGITLPAYAVEYFAGNHGDIIEGSGIEVTWLK